MPSLPSVFVELRANASQFTAAMKQAQGELKKTADLAQSNNERMAQVGKVAFAGLAVAAVGFGAMAVKAALDGQQAHAQLVQAVQNSGTVFSSVGGAIDDMSSRFAKLGFENDAVEAALARLVQGTGNVQGAMQNMGLVVDFARARHMELADAAGVVAKVMGGNVGILGRLGISTKDAAGNTLTAAQAVAMLNERFGGAAQAQANTYVGQMQALSAEFSNMQESIGNMLLPVLGEMAGVVSGTIGWFDKHREVTAALALVIGGPLVIAVNAFIAKQAIAFAEGTIATVQKMATAIGSFLVPATEAEAAALTTAATAEAFLTAGLSVVAGAAAIAGVALLSHANSSNDVAAGADAAAGSIDGLTGSEGDLGVSANGATSALAAQSDLFKKLNGDTAAISGEIFKLIGDSQSLDKATKALNSTTNDQAQNQKAATAAAKSLGDAQDKLNKATDTYNKLQAGLGNEISMDELHSHHDLEQAQLNHEQAQKKVTEAVAEYGINSDEARQASLDLESATFTLTDAQAAMGTVGEDAWQKVNDAQQAMLDAKDSVAAAVDKQREAIEKTKQPAADMAANTLAWQQAQNTLNADWGIFEGMIAAHPELRSQFAETIKRMRDNLPKGADTKPLNDLLDKLNGLDLDKIKQASLFTMVATGNMKFGPNDPSKILDILGGGTGAGPGAKGGGPSLESILTGGAAIFGGGAAEGAIVKARPGGTLMLVGEGGRDEAITPLGQAGGFGSVTIIINGNGRDDQELALMVRDELVKIGRNNVGVGLG